MEQKEKPKISLKGEILDALKQKRIVCGVRQCLAAIKHKQAKLVLINTNCPVDARNSILHHAKLANIPVEEVDINAIHKFPFRVSSLAILQSSQSSGEA